MSAILLLMLQYTQPPHAYAESTIVLPSGPALGSLTLESIADLNGDGERDLLIGAPDVETVWIYSALNSQTPMATLVGPQGSQFGLSVSSAPDVDGDGLEDILVGAPTDSGTGRVYLFATTNLTAPFALWGPPAPASTLVGSRYGESIARGGNLNFTGTEEILVGEPLFSLVGSSREGRVEVLNLPTVVFGPRTTQNTVVGGAGTRAGRAVDVLGDVDGDTIAEVLIGAPGGTTPAIQVQSGVFAGTPGLTPQCIASLESGLHFGNSRYGWNLAGLGDTNGGGEPDVGSGLPFPNQPGGFAQLHMGENLTGLPPASCTTVLQSLDTFELNGFCIEYGYSVSRIGDWDADGLEDLLVGAPANTRGIGPPMCVELGTYRIMSSNDLGTPMFTSNPPTWATSAYGYDVTALDTSTTGHAIADPVARRVHVFVGYNL